VFDEAVGWKPKKKSELKKTTKTKNKKGRIVAAEPTKRSIRFVLRKSNEKKNIGTPSALDGNRRKIDPLKKNSSNEI